MRVSSFIVSWCVLQVSIIAACGRHPSQAPIQDPVATIKADKGFEIVRQLTSDEMQGRGLSGQGLTLAAHFIAGRFAEAGLRPGGDAGSYFQHLKLTLSVKPQEKRNWVRFGEGSSRRSLKMGIEFVPLSVAATDARAQGQLVFVGYGITAPEVGYDDYAGIDAKGKIAVAMFYAPGSHMLEPPPIPPGQRVIPTAYEEIQFKALNARAHGATALILFHGPRSIGAREDALMGLDAFASREDMGIPVVQVIRPVLEELIGAEKIGEMQQSIDTTMSPRSFVAPETVPHFKIQTAFEREHRDAVNVVGVVQGSDPVLREEWVVVGAHYDHVGSCPDGKGLKPGADDNASGVAALALMADAMTQKRPKRSVAFVAFVGKEVGLVGSTSFLAKPPGKIVAMVNLDMVGRLGDRALGIRGMEQSKEWENIVSESNTENLRIGPVQGLGPSDHVPFREAGIPTILLSTGTHSDYHKPTDTLEKIDAEGIGKVARFGFRLVRALADRPSIPRP